MSEGLQAVKAELRKDAEKKAAQALEEGDAQAQAVLEEARAQARQIVSRAEEEAQQQALEESSRVSSARLAAARLVSEAREKAIGHALDSLLDELSSSASPRNSSKSGYEKLFQKLAKQGLKEVEGGVIRCRRQDLALARKAGRLGEPISCKGGLVVESADGRVRLDASFEGLLEERRDELGRKAFALLFGKE